MNHLSLTPGTRGSRAKVKSRSPPSSRPSATARCFSRHLRLCIGAVGQAVANIGSNALEAIKKASRDGVSIGADRTPGRFFYSPQEFAVVSSRASVRRRFTVALGPLLCQVICLERIPHNRRASVERNERRRNAPPITLDLVTKDQKPVQLRVATHRAIPVSYPSLYPSFVP